MLAASLSSAVIASASALWRVAITSAHISQNLPAGGYCRGFALAWALAVSAMSQVPDADQARIGDQTMERLVLSGNA
jgi:hypothetical protein